jgi:light-regulated signal transduction histidine kinase (bacteriophytochrome)
MTDSVNYSLRLIPCWKYVTPSDSFHIGQGLKNLTEANGGNIEVQSEVGKGSTFFVTLPSGSSDAGSL